MLECVVPNAIKLYTLEDIDPMKERKMKYVKAEPQKQTAAQKAEPKAEKFLNDNGMDYIPYFLADDKAIETMLRSNPGYILLKDAIVKGKGHYRNYNKIRSVDFEQLEN